MARAMRANQKILRGLNEALKHAEWAADPESKRCAASAQAKEEMRVYLTTWVIGYLKIAINEMQTPGKRRK